MTVMNKYDPSDEEMAFAMSSLPFTPDQRKVSKSPSKYEASDEDLDFAQGALSEPVLEEIPWYKSYPAAAAKGLSRFVIGAAESIRGNIAPGGLEEDISSYLLKPEEKKKIAEVSSPYSESEREKFEQDIVEKFPTNEGKIETIIEKGSELAPTALLAPQSLRSKAIRTGVAAGLGTIAKERGIGETGQALIQAIPFVTPSLSKKLVGKNPNENKLLEFGRSMGLTDKEILPGLRKETRFRKMLSKAAYKGKSTQETLEKSKSEIGNIYNKLRETPEAFDKLERKYWEPMFDEYRRAFKETSPSVRKKLFPSFAELLESKGKGDDFIKFYQHVYEDVGKDFKKIKKIQEVTKKSIKQISTKLGQDFELTNELYANMSKLKNRLEPPPIDIMQISKGLGAIYGIFSGDYGLLKLSLKALGGQQVAKALLLNPRYQNLIEKTTKALHEGRIHLAKETYKTLREEFKEISPEFYDVADENAFQNLIDYETHKRAIPKSKEL